MRNDGDTRVLEARPDPAAAALADRFAARDGRRFAGMSRPWNEAIGQAARVATSDTTVLITGESGTGKEVIARLIHRVSGRADKPFVAVNCAALPETLLESELFGYDKGAFTGAVTNRKGRIEQAAGGTLFLDEIAETSLRLQAKLLRVLETHEFQRLGGTVTRSADVRVVAATNRDLAAAMARGTFRADLYYRLDVFGIPLPPLRERPEDILVLADFFVDDLQRGTGRRTAGIARDARECLRAYSWPGNVRELRNAIERAMLFCDGGPITRDHLPSAIVNPHDRERGAAERALADAHGNRARAARRLGLTRAQFTERLQSRS